MTAKCTSIDNDNDLRPGADKEGGGGSRDIHVVPPPPPVPPSTLEPSAVQRVGSPLGGRVHRGGDLPLSPSTPVDSTSTPVEPFLPPGLPGSSSNLFTFLQPSFLANLPIQLPPPLPLLPSTPSPPLPPTGRKVPLVSQPLGAPFPESLLPLKDCPNPHFCVGGRNHVDFLRPGVGRDLPFREEVEWFTLR